MDDNPRTGVSFSASLDPSETSDLTRVNMSAPQLRIHARWAKPRETIILALRHGNDRCQRRARRIDGCCFNPEVRRGAGGMPLLVHNVCRDRLCPRCQIQRGKLLATRIALLTHSFNATRFVTFTLRHKAEPLDSMLDRLYDCFRALRKTKEWKRHVVGGVYCVQVTRNTKTGQWHAHLHCLVDGTFWAQSEIARVWERVTGDSKIVDIRAVVDRRSVASYVAEYVSRPDGIAEWGWDAIAEYAEAMHGRRLVHTFGTAHAQQVEDRDDDRDCSGGEFVADVLTLLRLKKRGSVRAAFVVNTLSDLSPTWARVLGEGEFVWNMGTSVISPQDQADALTIARELYLRPVNWREPAPAGKRAVQPVLIDVHRTA